MVQKAGDLLLVTSQVEDAGVGMEQSADPSHGPWAPSALPLPLGAARLRSTSTFCPLGSAPPTSWAPRGSAPPHLRERRRSAGPRCLGSHRSAPSHPDTGGRPRCSDEGPPGFPEHLAPSISLPASPQEGGHAGVGGPVHREDRARVPCLVTRTSMEPQVWVGEGWMRRGGASVSGCWPQSGS